MAKAKKKTTAAQDTSDLRERWAAARLGGERVVDGRRIVTVHVESAGDPRTEVLAVLGGGDDGEA